MAITVVDFFFFSLSNEMPCLSDSQSGKKHTADLSILDLWQYAANIRKEMWMEPVKGWE